MVKPLRSAQRVYIRYSIPHQSQLSVPPAPALSFKIALFLSYSPDNRVPILSSSNSLMNSSSSPRISGIRDSSFSSYPISIRVRISSYCVESLSHSPTVSFRFFSSFIFWLERSGSSQNPGASISRSISSIRFALLARSK